METGVSSTHIFVFNGAIESSGTKCIIELFLQLAVHLGVLRDVVDNGAGQLESAKSSLNV